jgi:protein-S-isoprenylcysteine O-methyltransferase Ste14
MRASDFEFRNRFWIFGILYFAGFVPYWFHDQNALVSVLALVLPNASERAVHVSFGLAALVMTIAALLRTWATAYLSTTVMKHSELQSAALVADGPYRYVRNPLYLGNLLMTLSFAALASRVGAVIVVVGVTLFVFRLISREEAQLEVAQGESFRRFCEAVPRMLPAFSPRVAASGKSPRWKQAFAGEAMMWGFVIAVAIFAVTLKTGVPFFIAVSLSIASNFVFHGNGAESAESTASAGK